ncbi:MAG: ABC transporter permease [Eubacteriales bacterium]|nr:ABC transporter permease [Eubacteriales bacterium]
MNDKNLLSMQIDLSKFNDLSKIDKSYFDKLTNEEKQNVEEIPKQISFYKDAFIKIKNNPLAILSIILLSLVIILILVGIFINPYKYNEIITINGIRDVTAQDLKPFEYSLNELEEIKNGAKIFPHIFGTDSICRDYFARVAIGSAISLFIGIFASILVLIIGLIYGSISGYLGGKVDLIMMRICDIIYSLPDMLIIILLSVILNPLLSNNLTGIFADLGVNIISLLIVFALLYWVSIARLVRGQILSIRKNEYIEACKLIGTPVPRIIKTHIIPNCMSIIFIATTLQIPSAIFTESFLSFVGLGVQIPLSSLGSLANDARTSMSLYPYKMIIPALLIAMLVLSFNLLGDAFRDAFDPKLKK